MSVAGIKFNGVEMIIDKIPQGQLCQAFDPIMILPEKTVNILDDHMEANTSCVAPAYVYMEGIHGKRFLCDYHYVYEWSITCDRTPHLWKHIAFYLIENIEIIKETFDFSNNTNMTSGERCWCGAPALVLLNNKIINNMLYFCNFHYRKTYYRYLSNNKKVEDIFNIFDERNKMTFSIKEEMEQIKNTYHV